MQDAAARDRVTTLEGLLEELETIEDPLARDRALSAVQALVELYGAGLERVVGMLSQRDDANELGAALAADELVSHLLLLHDLHPVPVEERVRRALDEVRPYLESHGGDVELLAVDDGVVRLRMEGSCSGCPSSTVTLKLAIEEAIRKAAPDVEEIEAEGAEQPGTPLPVLQVHQVAWTPVEGVGSLASQATEVREVDGEPVLFIRLKKSLYAYRPRCAACGGSLEAAEVADGRLACPACATAYDVRRAGRAVDGSDLHLQPVPLLENEADGVKVAA
jgi:Fe-S cluster biogenesis protein NfuA/nitrite reductase/ring-hydroxylating ferredoxin subunit